MTSWKDLSLVSVSRWYANGLETRRERATCLLRRQRESLWSGGLSPLRGRLWKDTSQHHWKQSWGGTIRPSYTTKTGTYWRAPGRQPRRTHQEGDGEAQNNILDGFDGLARLNPGWREPMETIRGQSSSQYSTRGGWVEICGRKGKSIWYLFQRIIRPIWLKATVCGGKDLPGWSKLGNIGRQKPSQAVDEERKGIL